MLHLQREREGVFVTKSLQSFSDAALPSEVTKSGGARALDFRRTRNCFLPSLNSTPPNTFTSPPLFNKLRQASRPPTRQAPVAHGRPILPFSEVHRMSGYSVPYSAPDSYELPLPVPIDSSWRPTLPPPPPASREQNLAQPFDQWSFRPPLDLPGPSYAANGIGQQGLPPQQPLRPQQLPASNNSGWGNGGLLHVSATIPDEMLPKQFAAGSELVKVTGKVREKSLPFPALF